jgi:uncharacterized protein
MSKRLPVELNVPRLSAGKACLRGTIKLDQFKRLAEYLHEPGAGDLDVELKFAIQSKATGFTADGSFSGDVKLECLRCADAMDFRFAGTFKLAFVQTDVEAKQVDGIYDPFPLDESGRVRSIDLIEDELILQIPMAPRHSGEWSCVDGDWLNVSAIDDNEMKNAREPNPFAVLKKPD